MFFSAEETDFYQIFPSSFDVEGASQKLIFILCRNFGILEKLKIPQTYQSVPREGGYFFLGKL